MAGRRDTKTKPGSTGRRPTDLYQDERGHITSDMAEAIKAGKAGYAAKQAARERMERGNARKDDDTRGEGTHAHTGETPSTAAMNAAPLGIDAKAWAKANKQGKRKGLSTEAITAIATRKTANRKKREKSRRRFGGPSDVY